MVKAPRTSRTYGGCLAICLNAEVEPPDNRCPRHLQRGHGPSLCGIEIQVPFLHDPRKVVAAIGRELEQRFVNLHGVKGGTYRQCLDPSSEQVQRTCRKLRRDALEDNLVLHYSGHGVPAPSALGELWFFNEAYTEYVPARVVDVASWLGAPRLMIFDCPCSGRAVHELTDHFFTARTDALNQDSSLPIIALGATSAGERLPVSEVFPADVFTACLTRPLEMAVQLSIQKNARENHGYDVHASARIPGTLAERRSPLGELNWVLTAITDAIAWDLLPQLLFCRLFRQDVTLSAIMRNFILASRVMWHLQCSVVSEPLLPASHAHPLWDQWDHTIASCLSQLHRQSPQGCVLAPASDGFFSENLTAFKVAIDRAAQQGRTVRGSAVAYLPIVLQALLSQSHRIRAICLLRGFMCLGPWAVQGVLEVGIFQYLAKLLNSSVSELRSALLHVWAILLGHDSSCKVEFLKASGHLYFAPFLSAEAGFSREDRILTFIVLGTLCDEYPAAQRACVSMGLANHCEVAAEGSDRLTQRWALFCWTRLIRANAGEDCSAALLSDPCYRGLPDVGEQPPGRLTKASHPLGAEHTFSCAFAPRIGRRPSAGQPGVSGTIDQRGQGDCGALALPLGESE